MCLSPVIFGDMSYRFQIIGRYSQQSFGSNPTSGMPDNVY